MESSPERVTEGAHRSAPKASNGHLGGMVLMIAIEFLMAFYLKKNGPGTLSINIDNFQAGSRGMGSLW